MKFLKAIHPLFLLALGLHAGLLMIPITGSSDEVIPAPDSETDSISITRVSPNSEISESMAVASKPATPLTAQPAQAQPRTPASVTNASQRLAAQAPAGRIAQAPTSNAGNQRASQQGRQNTPSNQVVSSQTGDSSQANASSTPASANNAELARLPSSNNTNPTVQTNGPAASTPTPQAPLTLAALANKATSELPDTLTRLADWFNRVYIYNTANTSNQDEAEARQQWTASLRERSGIETLDPQPLEKAIQVSYPLEKSIRYDRDFMNCLTEKPHKASVGVFFNETGEIQTEPTLLRSTGYEFLNQEALERVKHYADFPVQKAQKAYTVNVEIAYDSEACLALANVQQGN